MGEGDVDRAEKVKMLEKEVNLAKEVRKLLRLVIFYIQLASYYIIRFQEWARVVLSCQ